MPSKPRSHLAAPKPLDEKVSVNLGYVDLGQIDLLVRDGFYGNRTDFIRTAIRNQLARHADADAATADPIARLDLPAARAHLVERLRTDDLTGAQRSLQRIVELDVDPLAHPDMKRAVLDLLTKVAVLPGAASDQLFQMVSTRMGEPGLDLILLLAVAAREQDVPDG